MNVSIQICLLVLFSSAGTSSQADSPVGWPWRGMVMNSFDSSAVDVQYLKENLNLNFLALQLKPRLRSQKYKLDPMEAFEQELDWAEQMLDACVTQEVTAMLVIYQFPIDPTLGLDEKSPKFWDDPKSLDEVVRLSGIMANRFAKRGNELSGYQVLSEPTVWRHGKPMRPEIWLETLQRIITMMRDLDKDCWIAVTPGPGGSPLSYEEFALLPYKRIIYNAHMYLPHRYTHQGVKNRHLGPKYPGFVARSWWDKSKLTACLGHLRDFQMRNNVPVWVGEFSAARWAPGSEDYIKDLVDIFESYGWGWSYFQYNGSHIWNPDYDDNYASNKREEWTKHYIGKSSKRWDTLRSVFKVNKSSE